MASKTEECSKSLTSYTVIAKEYISHGDLNI